MKTTSIVLIRLLILLSPLQPCFGQIMIIPNSNLLGDALGRLGPKRKTELAEGVLFRLVGIDLIKNAEDRGDIHNSLFNIDGRSVLEFMNQALGNSAPHTVKVLAFRTTRAEYSGKLFQEWPIFTVELKVADPQGGVVSEVATGVGPAYYGTLSSRSANEAAIRSANIGYLDAVINALLGIKIKLDEKSPDQQSEQVNLAGQPKHGEDQRAKE